MAPDLAAPFWDIPETARYLGLNKSSVRILVERDKIAHYRIGPGAGRIKIKPADVLAYLETCRRGPAPKPPAPQPVKVAPRPQEGFDHFAARKARLAGP